MKSQGNWSWKRVEALELPSPRVGHSFSATTNPREFVLFGGANHEEGFLNDVYLYDVDTKLFKSIAAKNSQLQGPCGRYEHVAAVFDIDGAENLFIWGGSGECGLLNDTWLLNLETLVWRELQLSASPPGRTCHHGYAWAQGKLFMFGGGSANDIPISDTALWCFDPELRRWSTLACSDHPSMRQGHTFNATDDEKSLVLIGGLDPKGSYGDVWSFDISSVTWSKLTVESDPKWSGRGGHVTVSLFDRSFMVFGGFSKADKATAYEDFWAVNLATLTITSLCVASATPLDSPGRRLCMSMVPTPRFDRLYSSAEPQRLRAIACDEKNDFSEDKEQPEPVGGYLLFGGMDFKGLYNDMFYLCRLV